jgi:hypothetical protein
MGFKIVGLISLIFIKRFSFSVPPIAGGLGGGVSMCAGVSVVQKYQGLLDE